ncbi:hypothetical protein [Psychrobacter sp. FDAARGOS_221]|uniref:hypothetical protein n=1 Tax=Psychrobacter sp. FDAARGOS_221 TaxID=1975705 RepID=UPI000BB53EEC|nr:hypothetical protein [Psychrobacter sp. FDAARGOS_221]PNK60127.1 hypothetical protein A6J60_004065 [Psychrobacter sp. FDAARGOS_221]
MAKNKGIDPNSAENQMAIKQMQSKLRMGWLIWLLYRMAGLPILLGLLLATEPNIIGGIAWQLLWLIPALIITPWMVTGKSAYALLVSSMLSLIYLGASGVTLFSRFYDSGISVLWVYGIDLILLFLINVWLFKLLKRLPSMNG